MPHSLTPTIVRLTAFVAVCLLGMFALFATFFQLRFDRGASRTAEFVNVSGLQDGDFVRIAGVEVGKVGAISIRRDGVAMVSFTVEDPVRISATTTAAIRYDNLIGGRFLALEDPEPSSPALAAGQSIPLSRTQPALDLDSLIGGFRPLFRALDPAQVNALTGQLIAAFQGQGEVIGSFLAQTASLTNTLADRDQLIGQVITNLNTVLTSLSERSDHFDETITTLSDLVHGLAGKRDTIADAVGNIDAAAASITGLLQDARPPLKSTVAQTDRAAGIVVADHEYVDDLLNTLPDAYQKLARLGLSGDYFSYYLCDLFLKVNGKGGQPVYVKLAGQDSGRCAPK